MKKEILKELFKISDYYDKSINEYEVLSKLKEKYYLFNIEKEIENNIENNAIDEFNKIMITNDTEKLNNNELDIINSKNNLLKEIGNELKININYNLNYEKDNFENYLKGYNNKLNKQSFNNKIKILKNKKQNYLKLYNLKKNNLMNQISLNYKWEKEIEKLENKKNNEKIIEKNKKDNLNNKYNEITKILDSYFEDELYFINMNFFKNKLFKIYSNNLFEFNLTNKDIIDKHIELNVFIKNKTNKILKIKPFKILYKNDIEMITDFNFKNDINLDPLSNNKYVFKFKPKYFKYSIPTLIIWDDLIETKILLPLLIFNFIKLETIVNDFEIKYTLILNLKVNEFLKLYFNYNNKYKIELNTYELYINYYKENNFVKIEIGYNNKKYNKKVLDTFIEHLNFLDID